MRRLSAALVALTAAIALVALSAPAWAGKPRQKQLVVSPTEVRAGELVRVSGGGCRGVTVLVFLIDGEEFHRGPARSGDWSYQVRLPSRLRSGEHVMTAQCVGGSHKPASFHVSRRGSFDVWPDTVIAGDWVWADGNGCRSHSPVLIALDGEVVRRTFADEHGSFDKKIRIPSRVSPGRHVVSAFCGKRFLGSDGIRVKRAYMQPPNKVYTDASVVKPGRRLRVRGDDCRHGAPVALWDDRRIDLTVLSKGKGFSGEVTIPRGAAPGRHKFYAGCEDGSEGWTHVNVLDEGPSGSPAGQAFGPQTTSDLAMWAGLVAGLALLVASTVITTRRRRNHG